MQAIEHLMKQYQLLTDWYISVLDGIDDKDGSKTINDNANSLEWLAGHLIVGRYRNISRLGEPITPPRNLSKFIDLTIPPPNAIAFDKTTNYSSLTECKEQWADYSRLLFQRLNEVDEKMLKTELSFRVPIGGNTVEDALAFVALHESYHIGQMSVIRKALGYPAMQLSLRAK